MADIASILANAPMLNLQQAQQPAESFVWGQGGRRMTPEQVAAERARALELAAGDYSPVGHWTQGLGRIADGLEAGFARRDANRAADVNTAENDAVLQAILSGDGDRNSLITAATNPFVTDQTRTIAQSLLPKPKQATDFQRNIEYLRSVGRNAEADDLILKETDPTKSSTYIDPDTGQLMFYRYDPRDVRGGGRNISANTGAPLPSPAPTGDVGFADFSDAQRILQSGGPQALLAAQQGGRMPVRVNSQDELNALPSGALVMGPNGEVRRKP